MYVLYSCFLETQREKMYLKILGNSLVIQWLGRLLFHHRGPGFAGRGTRMPQAAWRGEKNLVTFLL